MYKNPELTQSSITLKASQRGRNKRYQGRSKGVSEGLMDIPNRANLKGSLTKGYVGENIDFYRESLAEQRKTLAESLGVPDYYQGIDIDTTVDTKDAQENLVRQAKDASVKMPTGAKDITGLGTLMAFVSGGEIFGGSLDAANRGTIGDDVVGSTKTAIRNGKKLSELTVGEIKKLQKIKDPNNEERLFAVGLFQMIPKTFLEAQKATGVKDNAIFNRETQEKMGSYLFSGKANTKKTFAYLSGDKTVSIDDAILGLAKEFASIPVPYDVKKGNTLISAGNTYYGGTGNKAKYTLEEVKSVLRGVKDAMM
jgi:hypothetical protein